MVKDIIKEASYRLGALVEIYTGPKIIQSLDEGNRDLDKTVVQVSNDARTILDAALKSMKMAADLEVIVESAESLQGIGSSGTIIDLWYRVEKRLSELQGMGAPTSVYEFTWYAILDIQLRKYAPHRTKELENTRKAVLSRGKGAGLTEGQVQSFMADPKHLWGPTVDLLLEKRKSFLGGLVEAKELRFTVPGEATDSLIRKWLSIM